MKRFEDIDIHFYRSFRLVPVTTSLLVVQLLGGAYTVINCVSNQHARVSKHFDTQTCENDSFACEIQRVSIFKFVLAKTRLFFQTTQCGFHTLEGAFKN
jgi:hypothetical protein